MRGIYIVQMYATEMASSVMIYYIHTKFHEDWYRAFKAIAKFWLRNLRACNVGNIYGRDL
jgi:hypothetical protein